MLDDVRVLRDAAEAYRVAATAFGVPWLDDGDRADEPPLDLLCRAFDVDHIAGQAIWLKSQWARYGRVLPDGGFVLPWPADARDLLWDQGSSAGVPFHWRHQLPLLTYERIYFMVVLAGDHEGEIWRSQHEVDDRNPVRAAPSLAAMLSEWTKGFSAGAYDRSPWDTWLHIVGDGDPVNVLLERGLDPFAFPVHISSYSHGDLLMARQRECGVDRDRADNLDCLEELDEAIHAARDSLSL